MQTVTRKKMIVDGVLIGLLAGVVFAIFEMIFAGSVAGPWRAFASIVMGTAALERGFSLAVVILGAVVHFALSAIYGAIFALLVHELPERVARNLPAVSGLGVAFGLALWIVNFGIFANLLFPWFLEMSQAGQILLHTLAFGLPLGVGIWIDERMFRLVPRKRLA